MKKYSIVTVLMFSIYTTHAQNRQDVANFSQFHQYYNPALTGYEGSSIKNFYRDQWTSVEDAPRTLFLSAEAKLADITRKNTGKLQHSFGLSLLNDRYGALADNRFALSYSSGVQLNEKFHLRAGLAATFNNTKIDNEKLVLNEGDDQAYMSLLNGSNQVKKYGVNLGIALTSDNFYAGYALTDAVQSDNSGDEYFKDMYAMQHIVQAGYRRSFAQPFGLVVNGIYRYDEKQKGIAEGQLKGVYNNTFWLGAGYRNDLAYTFSTGIQLKQFKVGYSREINSSEVSNSFKGENELTITYNFTPSFSGKKLTIW